MLGGLLHVRGAWAGYRQNPELLVWAWSGSLAALLVAALNLLRSGRPDDRGLARVALAGSFAWILVAIGFGIAIGSVFDPRAVIHAVNAVVLAGMSAGTLRQARRPMES